jgi:hypothetical protein
MTELPPEAVDEAERLTRLARRAGDPDERTAYRERRGRLLDRHGYVARLREADDTLVCYPARWVDETGTVRPSAIDDTDSAVEIPFSGPGDPEAWDAVEADNAALVAAVAEAAGDDASVHRANARAVADFAGNHYAKRIERLAPDEVAEFREEYFPRNAWPGERQRALLDRSLELLFEVAGVEPPPTGGDGEER